MNDLEHRFWEEKITTATMLREAAEEDTKLNLIAHLKPKLSIDGNMYCLLFGKDLQEGICGFGESMSKAVNSFYEDYHADLIIKKEIEK